MGRGGGVSSTPPVRPRVKKYLAREIEYHVYTMKQRK